MTAPGTSLNIVFFGSDNFSLPALNACLDSGHQTVLVVTTPARPKGRGLRLMPNQVQSFAEASDLPFITPANLKDEEAIRTVRDQEPDLFVVSSYGNYIPGDYLGLPRVGSLNVHPSLIPRYRGSGPIQWAILNGDAVTGLTIMAVDRKLDAGEVYAQREYRLGGTETHESLEGQLADLSYEVLLGLLRKLPGTPLKGIPQNEDEATYARKLTKEDGRLQFDQEARELERKVRGLKPWPGTFIESGHGRLAVLEAECINEEVEGTPGKLVHIDKAGFTVETRRGLLRIARVQPAGKKAMAGADFIRGRRIEKGHVFSCR